VPVTLPRTTQARRLPVTDGKNWAGASVLDAVNALFDASRRSAQDWNESTTPSSTDVLTLRVLTLRARFVRIGRIGWHTFRHTFRRLLDETGAPMKVQQELMRHADIRTTMKVFGKAMDASKREPHGKVVRMVLASKVA